jgi:L-seryl-tRNA(Ser) seleniumtransferase
MTSEDRAMGIYDALGVRPVINAAAAQTVLGGSLMPEPVLDAMRDAAQSFVHLPELHDRVGERIAALTHNEAACLCAGAAAGILVAVAAAMTGDDPGRATQLPDTAGFERTELVVFDAHQTGFLSAARESGATLVTISGREEALTEALTPRTAAVLWFAGDFWPGEALPLDRTVAIAHEQGVPVIVDAADQIPPVEHLWRYTRDLGADLAIFSGGKGLRGPQSSGLIVGGAGLIRACRLNSGPLHSIGRPAKVGKEEMAGLLAAVEWALARDPESERRRQEEIVQIWMEGAAGLQGVAEVRRASRSHSGQPIPRAIVDFGDSERRDAVFAALWAMTPRVAVLPEGETALALNPQAIEPGQDAIVLASLTAATRTQAG